MVQSAQTGKKEIKPLAVIPARGGSKRFPRKNIAALKGKPLISYSIGTALQSDLFSQVIVSTEDAEIADIAKQYGAVIYKRSKDLATDKAHELEAVAEILDAWEEGQKTIPSFFCVLYPTAPMIGSEDLQAAWQKLMARESAGADVDGLMCVSSFNYHPYKALGENKEGHLEMLFPKMARARSQTYPHLTASNGTFYWLRTGVFRKNRGKGYYQDKIIAHEIESERAVDIDYPEDLLRVKQIMELNKRDKTE